MNTDLGIVELIKDIKPDLKEDNFSWFSEFNGKIYFSVDDGVNSNELCLTDGTNEGTILVQDFNPVTPVVDEKLFLSADNNEMGTELFKLTVDNFNSEPEAVCKSSLVNFSFGNGKNVSRVSIDRLSSGSVEDLLNYAIALNIPKGRDSNYVFYLRLDYKEEISIDFSLDRNPLRSIGDLQFVDLILGEEILAETEVLTNFDGLNTVILNGSDFKVILTSDRE